MTVRGLVAVAMLALAACSGEADPTPTESVCPSDSTLTYDNFGKPFMESYCTRCHSSTLHGDDRMGAPTFHDFDSELGIQRVANHVDEWAAAGPAAVNTLMPPEGDKPTEAERRQLGEYIACMIAASKPAR